MNAPPCGPAAISCKRFQLACKTIADLSSAYITEQEKIEQLDHQPQRRGARAGSRDFSCRDGFSDIFKLQTVAVFCSKIREAMLRKTTFWILFLALSAAAAVFTIRNFSAAFPLVS